MCRFGSCRDESSLASRARNINTTNGGGNKRHIDRQSSGRKRFRTAAAAKIIIGDCCDRVTLVRVFTRLAQRNPSPVRARGHVRKKLFVESSCGENWTIACARQIMFISATCVRAVDASRNCCLTLFPRP